MMKQYKKFISPEAWFSMHYPTSWAEFEDGEGSFLFYNPNEWTGNFRISAYRGDASYAQEVMSDELKANDSATKVNVRKRMCVYYKEMFEENGVYYTSHCWLTGEDDLLVECSFTLPKGEVPVEAEEVIASLEMRKPGVKYPAEIISIRLSEVFQINEAYEWVEKYVKETLSKDFQGVEEDVLKMQEALQKRPVPSKKKEAWLAMGIALCVILANEVDGWEWATLVDGNREVPVLKHVSSGDFIDPMKLTWSKVKAGESCNLVDTYQSLLQ